MKALRALSFAIVGFSFLVLLSSCESSELKEPVEYTGPLRIAEGVETFYTEEGKVKLKMIAGELHEFENGDRSFPDSIYLEFYDEFANLESTLRANEAYYFKKDDLWRARGKVEVRNMKQREQLNTEELFWKPKDELIYTDKFVTIRQEDAVYYGEGMEAREDMSNWLIKKPTGEFEIEEE